MSVTASGRPSGIDTTVIVTAKSRYCSGPFSLILLTLNPLFTISHLMNSAKKHTIATNRPALEICRHTCTHTRTHTHMHTGDHTVLPCTFASHAWPYKQLLCSMAPREIMSTLHTRDCCVWRVYMHACMRAGVCTCVATVVSCSCRGVSSSPASWTSAMVLPHSLLKPTARTSMWPLPSLTCDDTHTHTHTHAHMSTHVQYLRPGKPAYKSLELCRFIESLFPF